MSYFSGCCSNLVKFVIFFIMTMMIVSLQTSMGFEEEEDNNHLQEFWSREELVRLAGYGEEKLSTVLITGTVLCDGTPLGASPVSGALVGINCGEWSQQSSAAAEAVTDEYGEFQIDLPSQLHAILNLEKACSLKVLRMPKNSACKLAFGKEGKTLTLLLARDGVRVYTAGEIKLSSLKDRAE
ncbi:conserved hypothetical protein [Ricinus communis]|uniref:Uncharacterized protein n=1 Tax=Ricinus communis TaxID=3988 RepID=B9SA60_RICCO|nr:conserved hypothetical protein [Ricinus communis]|eukprot:XP_002522879.1 uncharacterized protein LOC8280759 [Ricinus communis]